MVDQLIRYKSYSSGVKRMLLFAGLWPGLVSSKYIRLIIIFHLLTVFATMLAVINFITHQITNLDLMTTIKILALILAFITILLKVAIFSINHNNLVKLHEILETSFQKDLSNIELQPILLSPLEFFYHPTIWLTVSTCSIVMIYCVTPIISLSIQLARRSSPIKYRLPFPTQYPWSIKGNSILYPIQYFFEVCAGSALAIITASSDALFGFYIFQMSSQFRTLSYRMSNLKSEDNYFNVIKECAERYRTLLLCRKYLERTYGPTIVWILLTSALFICSNIYQASQISADKAALVMVYICMKLMQTFLYGWCGSFLTTESENFRESVYSSGWAGSGNRSFMSNVLIMLMYKPMVLTASHFSPVSIDIFLAITNTAMSYFFLLRTFEEGN